MRDARAFRNPPTAIVQAAHFRLKGQFARFELLGREEIRKKNRLSHEIQQELDILLELEEVYFYPAVRDMNGDPARPAVLRALRDHVEIKNLLKELRELNSESRSLDSKMNALKGCVLGHLELEESQVFPHSRGLPVEALHDLSGRMEELRNRLPVNTTRMKRAEDGREPLYPTLQDENGAPEDDRETPSSFASPGELNERHPSDFDGWGS